tara:strand:+ start:826 stop:1359 length:534 start_codon:yes stop_codon:yes gene_type:complete
MNIQKLFFKIIISFTYLLRIWILILPISIAIIFMKEEGWRYGFTFIQSNLNVAFFTSFALGFLISLYHTLSFEEAEGVPDQNYLKSHQEVQVKSDFTLDQMKEWLTNNTKYKEVKLFDNQILALKKVYFSKADKIKVSKKENVFTIKSAPHFKWWFIDFARNYKTVKSIATVVKKKV